jgi:phage gp36-like protein
MSYCTRANIEDRYGVTNVSIWADLDADADATKITNRIARAIAVTDARIEDELRNSASGNQLPLTNDAGNVPTTLTEIAVKLAGYWLSTARGVRDYDTKGNPITRLYSDYTEAIATLGRIVQGQLKVGGPI